MSSLQFSLSSTAGLRATTDTPDRVASVLARHLHEVCDQAAVEWQITAPDGAVRRGCFQLTRGQSAPMAIADHVDQVHGALLRDAARLLTAAR